MATPTIAPTVTLTIPQPNCCQQVFCCSSGNTASLDARRIVVKGDGLEAEAEPTCCDSFLTCLRRVFCCCSTPTVSGDEAGVLAVDRYQTYLRQKYGDVPAMAAPVLARIDLDAKRGSGDLVLRDVQAIDGSAQSAMEKLPEMTELFKLAKFYAEAQREEEAAATDVHVGEPRTLDTVYVQGPDGSTTRFEAAKLRARIQQVVERAEERQIDAIVERVRARLFADGEERILSDRIRRYVVEELRRDAIAVKKPEVMDRLGRDRILACRQIRELRPDELVLFYPRSEAV
jgi:hypothetical protein